jgi:ankyrin repeat protein
MGCSDSSLEKRIPGSAFGFNHQFEMYGAILSNNHKKINKLLGLGFDKDYQMVHFFSRTCAHIAAEVGEFETFKLFVNLDSDLNKEDRYKVLPTFTACERGDIRFIELCLQRKAKIKGQDINHRTIIDYIPKSKSRDYYLVFQRYGLTYIYNLNKTIK